MPLPAASAINGLFPQDEDFPVDMFLEDDDHFALQDHGDLVVPEASAGDFRFAVHSDEGSRLRIDGADVIVDTTSIRRNCRSPT